MNHYKQAISPFGEREVSIEFGEIGRQADAAVMVDMEGTVVLVAVTGRREALPNASFLPLTVDYQEKTYAAGKIPGGFFRREGRPSEKEVLTCRLIDRSLRPLFPDFYYHETQVIATVMSFNPEVEADIPAMIGAAAAMELSGIPFAGPIAAARVGRREGQIVVNPTCAETAQSDLDLIVAGSKNGVLMVESEARELPEETMLQAVMSGHAQIQNAIAAISQLVERAGKPKWDWQAPKLDDAKKAKIKESVGDSFAAAYRVTEKQARTERLSEIRRAAREAVVDASSTSARGKPRQFGTQKNGSRDCARAHLERRTAHRRSRHARHSPDLHSPRRVAAGAWLGAFHARRNASAGGGDSRHRTRRAKNRDLARRAFRALFDALQYAALCDRRDRALRHPEAARDRTRTPRQALAHPRFCPIWRSSATRCASFRKSPNRTDRVRWPRFAAARSR